MADAQKSERIEALRQQLELQEEKKREKETGNRLKAKLANITMMFYSVSTQRKKRCIVCTISCSRYVREKVDRRMGG